MRQQFKQAKVRGIIFGLSGGVDSSVVAALAKEAVARNRVLGLLLPVHSSAQDSKDAKLVARKLKIKTKLIDLSGTYDNLLYLYPKGNPIAKANLKARLRMATLYFLANKLNYLVCGTGNKSELLIGYFTKYGDGATDILPIADLFKHQVRELARDLGIPERIINKPPTAGLWLGQTDEGEIGMSYAELDDILERMEKGKKQIYPQDKVNRVENLIKDSEHKRQGPKICYV